MRIREIFILTTFLLFCPTINASDIEVIDPWVRVAPPGSPMAGYFSLENHSHHSRHLVSARAEGFGMTMLHRSTNKGGLVKMEHVGSVEIEAGGRFLFAPGEYHIMLMHPQKTLDVGAVIPITLEFRNGMVLETTFPIRGLDDVGNSDQ